jgi:hypothetical protein
MRQRYGGQYGQDRCFFTCKALNHSIQSSSNGLPIIVNHTSLTSRPSVVLTDLNKMTNIILYASIDEVLK